MPLKLLHCEARVGSDCIGQTKLAALSSKDRHAEQEGLHVAGFRPQPWALTLRHARLYRHTSPQSIHVLGAASWGGGDRGASRSSPGVGHALNAAYNTWREDWRHDHRLLRSGMSLFITRPLTPATLLPQGQPATKAMIAITAFAAS